MGNTLLSPPRGARRSITLAVALSLASLGVAVPLPAGAASTWHVQVGAASADTARGTAAFYPNDLTVHPGDTIEFGFQGFHTVTVNPFPAPVFAFFGPFGGNTLTGSPAPINSGAMPAGVFSLNVAGGIAPGSYKYRCMIHPLMEGVINVIASDQELPKTDAQNMHAAHARAIVDLAHGHAIATASEVAAAHASDIGGTGLEVAVGGGDGTTSVLRFLPGSATAHVGDTITFFNRELYEPHTVTFNTDFPPGSPAELFPLGNPASFNGTTPLHSGFLTSPLLNQFLGLQFVGLPPNRQISITFTAPGTFRYICTLHDDLGMVASVTILP